ncbi:MAG: patatin family protein [Coriobacteriales bacterium]|jgi:predicted patatin/cPLA2 family phospholipase|nr:patatin family protein [Coriobacteriales bacterium]
MRNNVHDVALIFEGGGMRNSYSSGLVNVLLENGIFFNDVYGLSAGATNAINYLSRDLWRSKVSFTNYRDDFAFKKSVSLLMKLASIAGGEAHLHGETGGEASVRSAVEGRGRGHAPVGSTTHGRATDSKNGIPFDFAAFESNPARLTLNAINRDTGSTAYFTRRDVASCEELMRRVRASSSYPIIMPPTHIDGRLYYDGGIGEGGGIMLPRAEADGFSRFFVVCTRPRGYRKPTRINRVYDLFFWRRPRMRKALDTWAVRYNTELDRLEDLEAEGRAFVFYATHQSVENTEMDRARLQKNYEKGYEEARGQLDAWRRFLGL